MAPFPNNQKTSPPPASHRHLWVLFLSICATILIIYGGILPQYNELLVAQTEILNKTTKTVSLEKEIADARFKLKQTQRQVEQKNILKNTHLNNILPTKDTDLVRMLDSFSYHYNEPGQPFVIKNISLNKNPQQASDLVEIEVNINFSSSKQNLDRFLYLIESSGTEDASELIDLKKFDTLHESLNQDEKSRLDNLLTKEKDPLTGEFSINMKNNADRQDIINFIRGLKSQKTIQDLATELFSKMLFYQEVKIFIEESYFPIQLMTMESFSLRFKDSPDSRIDPNPDGSYNMTAQLKAYFQPTNDNLPQ